MWAQASEIFLEEERFVHTSTSYLSGKVSSGSSIQNRSKGYYYIFSAFYIAEMVSSGLASATLDISPWIPSALAYGSILFCLVIQLRIPQRSEQHRADSQNMGRRSPADEDLTEQENASLCREGEFPKTTSFRAAFSNHNVLLVVPAFFVGSTRYTVLNVLMQYAHVRFGWIVSRTALIYTETAIVNICLFLIVMPRLTTSIKTKYGVRPQTIDLTMVRTSVCLLSFGTLCLALSPNATTIIASEFNRQHLRGM